MGEKMKGYGICFLRCVIMFVVLAVFAGFTPFMTTLWHKCILTGAMAAYALVLLSKWGVVEWMQVRGCGLVSEMASCDFCLSWWMCVLMCGFGWLITGSVEWIPSAFVATMVCRMLK
jgi:hypothetical protein